MADATAYIASGSIQSDQQWYAWLFDRQSAFLQTEEGWYEWNFARQPLELTVSTAVNEPTPRISPTVSLPTIEVVSNTNNIQPVARREGLLVASLKRYTSVQKDAVVRLKSRKVRCKITKILANGTIKINNVVKLPGANIEVGSNDINAEGVLGITAEEIMMLMAA